MNSTWAWVLGLGVAGVVGVGGYLLYQEAQRVEREHSPRRRQLRADAAARAAWKPSAAERRALATCIRKTGDRADCEAFLEGDGYGLVQMYGRKSKSKRSRRRR